MTRLIAGALKESGVSVLARTTGSKPMIVFPDGSEKEIERRGHPSILEGKKILKLASQLKVKALVVEMMSIQPECLHIESLHLFKPHILVLTNIRTDHISQMGSKKKDVAGCFSSSIPSQADIFIPKEDDFAVIDKTAKMIHSNVHKVSDYHYDKTGDTRIQLPFYEFDENISLSLAVLDFIGIERQLALKGMSGIQLDYGSLKVWKTNKEFMPPCQYFVNLFASNDPESTKNALMLIKKRDFFKKRTCIGVLSLRDDRGDRSLQWLESLKKGTFSEFKKFFFVGKHSFVMKRKLGKRNDMDVVVYRKPEPERIIHDISKEEKGSVVIVGMGNIEGFGKKMVGYWEKEGEICAL